MTNLRCPHCRRWLWPWQMTLTIGWNYKYIRRLHLTCALHFRRVILEQCT